MDLGLIIILLYVGAIAYVIVLLTRLTKAVERIASHLERRES